MNLNRIVIGILKQHWHELLYSRDPLDVIATGLIRKAICNLLVATASSADDRSANAASLWHRSRELVPTITTA